MVRSLIAGFKFTRRRLALVLLFYIIGSVLAFLITLPLHTALSNALGATGAGVDLAAHPDPLLWAGIWDDLRTAMRGIFVQLFWIVPVLLVWKTAASVGLVNALRDGGVRSFWDGVGRFTGRGLLLAALYLAIGLFMAIGIGVVVAIYVALQPGEVASFRASTFVLPISALTTFAVLDLMHDYSRIGLVKGRGVWGALTEGLGWPFRHRGAIFIYFAWFVPALAVVILPTVLDWNLAAATASGVWSLFLGQQLVFLLRAMLTVGWWGSEVDYYERVASQELPLIADAARDRFETGMGQLDLGSETA